MSIVIPTIGQSDLIWGSRRVMVVEAVRSLLDRTAHDNLEIVVVYDEPTPPEVLDELREVAGDKLTLELFAALQLQREDERRVPPRDRGAAGASSTTTSR